MFNLTATQNCIGKMNYQFLFYQICRDKDILKLAKFG